MKPVQQNDTLQKITRGYVLKITKKYKIKKINKILLMVGR
jgi:hypothetical protein